MILLHGFAASTFTWRAVMAPLTGLGTVVAYDRPSSGLTQWPLPGDWSGASPYGPNARWSSSWPDESIGVSRAVLIGNSAGGTVAFHAALPYPERVTALILVDAAIYTRDGAPPWATPLLGTPQLRRIGPLLVRSVAPVIRSAGHSPN
jgi:pimeloyl-ACP methyl ester carboxylesterase